MSRRGLTPVVAQLAEHAVHHRNAFEGVILALQRHEQAVAGGKGVQGQNAQRRRAINENHVEPLLFQNRLERIGDAQQMIFQPRQFQVGGAQIHFAGDHFQPLEGGAFDFVEQAAFAEQDAIGAGALGFFQAQPAGGVGLRVEVEQQHALAERRRGRRRD